MAAALRSTSSYVPAVGTTNHVVSTPTGFQSGDLLVMIWVLPVVAGTTPPTGWTTVDNVNHTGSLNYFSAWKIAAGTEGSSQTFTSSASGRPAGIMMAFSGVNNSVPFGNAISFLDSGSASGVSRSTNPINVSSTSLCVSVFPGYLGSAGTLSFTPNASWTEQADVPNTNNGAGIEMQTLVTSGSGVQGSATPSASVEEASWIFSLNDVGVGGGGGGGGSSSAVDLVPVLVTAHIF